MPDLGPQQATPPIAAARQALPDLNEMGRYLIYEQRMLLFFFALLIKMKKLREKYNNKQAK